MSEEIRRLQVDVPGDGRQSCVEFRCGEPVERGFRLDHRIPRTAVVELVKHLLAVGLQQRDEIGIELVARASCGEVERSRQPLVAVRDLDVFGEADDTSR